MDVQATTPVARIAARWPATIRVFQRHGIDFCCKGGRPVGEVCEEKGLELSRLLAELADAERGEEPDETDWTRAPLADLVEHILRRYHDRLAEDLPRLSAMAAAVVAAHGASHPEVREVAATLAALRADLEAHTWKEERVLFPAIVERERVTGGAGTSPGLPLAGPIQAMEAEHEEAGRAFARLRSLSTDYQPPSGACPTFRGLYQGLSVLESDTHRHIHLENNILFPRATELRADGAR